MEPFTATLFRTPGKGGWAVSFARCVMASRFGLELDAGDLQLPDLEIHPHFLIARNGQNSIWQNLRHRGGNPQRQFFLPPDRPIT